MDFSPMKFFDEGKTLSESFFDNFVRLSWLAKVHVVRVTACIGGRHRNSDLDGSFFRTVELILCG